MPSPDFRLVVGADVTASYSQLKEDIQKLSDKLQKNTIKVKLGIDPKSVSSLQSDIKSALGKVKFDDIFNTKSLSGIGDGIFGTFKDTVTSSLTEISKLVADISSKNFNINIGVNNAETVKEKLSALKGEVLSYAEAFNKMPQILGGINNDKSAVRAIQSMGVDFEKAMREMLNNQGDLYKWQEKISKATSVTDLKLQIQNLESYRAAVIPVLEAAQKLGAVNIDLSKFTVPELPKSLSNTSKEITDILQNITGNAQTAFSEAGKAVAQEADTVEKATSEFTEHSTVVKDAAEAEKIKSEVSSTVATAVKEESTALEKVSEASVKDAEASEKAAESATKVASARKQVTEAAKAQADAEKQAYDSAISAVNKYYDALKKLNTNATARRDVSQIDGVWQSQSGSYANLAENLNQLKKSCEDAINVENRGVISLEKFAQVTELAKQRETEYKLAIEDTAAKELEAARRAEEAAEKRRQAAEEREAARELKRQEAEETRAAAEAEKQAYDDVIRKIREYYEALRQLNSDSIARQKIVYDQGADSPKGWIALDSNYDALADKLNHTKTAFDLVTEAITKNALTTEHLQSVNQLIARSQEEYNIAIGKTAAKEEEQAQKAEEAAQKVIAAEEKKRQAIEATAKAKEQANQNKEDAALMKMLDSLGIYESKFNDIKRRLESLGNSNATSELVASYERLQAILNTMKSDAASDKERVDAQERWKLALQETTEYLSKQERAVAEATRQQNELASAAEKAAKDVSGLYEKIAGLGEASRAKLDVGDLDKIVNALRTLRDETASVEQRKAALEELSSAFNAVSESVDNLKRAEQEEAAQVAEQERARKQLESSLTQAYKLYDQVTEAQRKYADQAKISGAQGPYGNLEKSREEIQGIIDKLEELRNTEGKIDAAAIEKLTNRLRELKTETAATTSQIKNAGNAIQQYFTKGLTQLKSRLSYTFGFAAIVMKSVQEIKKMISTAVELDTAMTQLQIVTRNSTDDMAAYSKQVSQMAKDTAQSTKDLIDATTVYARLGYSMDESAVLAKYTAMLQGVGNIDASTAQDAMTAIIKAFDMGVNDIETIMDKMVTVGNNFPISVSEIAQGMNNAGSSLSAAGNSLEESIALLTAANTTVQNISKSSTGLRTIAARLRKTTVELDDLGETIEEAKYQKVLDMLTGRGVEITRNGEYRSTYDILKDIARIWDQLSTMERAGVAEQLAGTRQQNVFYSIIEQFQEATEAMDAMGDSEGALTESYDIYMNSIQAHVNKMKAAYDELAVSFLDSDFAKGAVDALRGILEVLTWIIDKIGVLGLALGGITAFKIIPAVLSGQLVSSIYTIIAALHGANMELTTTQALIVGATKAIPVIAALAAAITAAKIAATVDMKAHDYGYAVNQVKEINDELNKYKDRLKEVDDRIEALNDAREEGTLTTEQSTELTLLEAENAVLKQQIELYEERSKAAEEHLQIVARETAMRMLNPTQEDKEFGSTLEGAKASYRVNKRLLKENPGVEGYQRSFEAASNGLIDYYEQVVSLIGSLDTEKDAELISRLLIEIADINRMLGIKGLSEIEKSFYASNREALGAEMHRMGEGGAVDLFIRPVIDTQALIDAGWEDAGEGAATLFSSTFINEAGNRAANFTPIFTDDKGNVHVLSERDLTEYAESVLEGAEDNLGLQIGAEFVIEDNETTDDLIERAAAAGQRLSGLQGIWYADQIDGYDEFKKKLKDLDKNVLSKFVSGVEMTEDELKSMSEWFEKSGYSVDEASRYLRQYVQELQNASSGSLTGSAIGDLTSLRDELSQTTAALEEYKQAMQGGEKGDTVKEMAEIYKGALEDIAAGKLDSNRMHAVADLFFSDEQLRAWQYDLKKVAQALNSDMMKYLFDPESEGGDDYGQRFAKYIRDNFSRSNGVWVDGNNFYYNSVADLANAFGMSEEACIAFIDSLDAYGISVMRSTEENTELIHQFYDIQAKSKDAREAVEKFAQQMRDDGKDKYDIISILQDLQNIGVINVDDTQLAEVVSSVFEKSEEIDESNPILKIDANAAGLFNEVGEAERRLQSLCNGRYNVYISATTTVGKAIDAVSQMFNRTSGSGSAQAGSQGITPSGPSKKSTTQRTSRSKAAGGKASGGKTLVNELGPELISDDGEAFIANGGEPGFVDLSKNAIVFTAEETEEILRKKSTGANRSRAFASGTRASLRDRLIAGGRTAAKAAGDHNKKACPNCGGLHALIASRCVYCGYSFNEYNWQCWHCSWWNPTTVGICSKCGESRYGPQPVQTPTPTPVQVTYPVDAGQDIIDWGGYDYDSSGYGSGYSSGGYSGGGYDSYQEPRYSKVDWIEKLLDRARRAAQSIDKIVNSTFKNLSTRVNAAKEEASLLTEEIRSQWDAFNRYSAEAEGIGLSEDLAEKVRNGSINIVEYDEDTVKLINEYAQWYEKALDCKQAIDDLHESIAQLYTDTFTNVQTDFENRLSETEHSIEMINKNISMAQAHGYLDNVTYYSDLIANTTNEVATLELELSELNRYFNEAMATEEIDEYSEAWYEMKQAIADTEEALADANIQLVEYKNTMREIQWNAFDYAMGRVSQIGEEAQFLINLMSNDNLFQDNGQFNDLGEATAGMHVVNYDSYMAQADEYAKEIQKIEREMAGDPYNSKLIERREELLSLQRQNILSAESEKNAIKDLVSQGIQMELTSLQDLIDAYVDALDSAKDLYDYQRKVAEQTGDIAALEKQLTAYQNDTSEENRARVQKLQQQLREARQNLSDTEYDRSISDQKKLLDELYTEYEDAMNGRLDNVDALMAEMINGANENRDAINTTIHEVADEVGYTITEGFNYVMGEQFSNYSGMFENLNGIHATIINIYDLVAAMSNAGGAVKAYAKGGIIDYTGLAAVHGSPGNPEMVLSAADTAKFLEAAALMRNAPSIADIGTAGFIQSGFGGTVINGLNISIPIEHVQDYNDMIAQMQRDPKFDRLINAITLDRAAGKSNLSKYGVRLA